MRTAMQQTSSMIDTLSLRTRTPSRRRRSSATVRTEHLENRLLFASYSAVGDFGLAQNPNGVWTYGEITGTTFNTDAVPTAGTTRFSGQGATNPTFITEASNTQNLIMGPGQAGASADLRWTAPADGTYSVSGMFTDSSGAASDDVHILLNSTPLTTGNIGTGTGATSTVPFNQSAVVVHAGDHIDFVVGPGTDGWDSSDQVGLSATIATTGTTNSSGLGVAVSGHVPTKTEIAGQRAVPPFNQIVTLTNNGTDRLTGPVTINLTLSATSAGATNDPVLGTISRRINLAAGRSIRFLVPVRQIPPNASGDFFLVAQVTDPNGQLVTGSSSSQLTVEPPTIVLTGAFSAGVSRRGVAGRRILVPVIASNTGNVTVLPKNGTVDVSLIAASNTATVNLGTFSRRAVVGPQRRDVLLFVVSLPADMPAGTYTLTGTMDPNDTFNAPTTTNNTFTDSFPLVVT